MQGMRNEAKQLNTPEGGHGRRPSKIGDGCVAYDLLAKGRTAQRCVII